MRNRLLVLICCLVAGCAGKSAPEPVYVGHLAKDNAARDAILLAVEEANASDEKVAGRPVAVLHPEVKDDADADRTAIRLVTIDRAVGLLAGVDPGATDQLCRTAQQYSVPLVATVSPADGTLPPFGFSVGLSSGARGKALARFLADDLKKPAVAVIKDSRGPVNTGVVTAFVEQYRSAGGKVDNQWNYASDKELSDLFPRIAAAKPGAVVFVGPPGDFARIGADKSLGGIPLLFGGDETAPNVLSSSGKVSLYRVTAFALDQNLPRTKEFADKYEGRFHRPSDAPTALAYDSARVLFDALRRAGGFQGTKVREELLNTKDFESTTGPLSFDKAQNARRTTFIVQLENGKEKLVKRYDPE